MTEALTAEVRRILARVGRLSVDVDSLGDQDDLYLAGLSSLASVDVMIALEDAFDIQFPPEMLNRRLFESITSIALAVAQVKAAAA